MEAANKRVGIILGQLFPSSPLWAPGIFEQQQRGERECPGSVCVANLGRMIGNAPRQAITVERCSANVLDEKVRSFAYRLRGDSGVEQGMSLASVDSEGRFSNIPVARAETCSGSDRIHELGEESRMFGLIRNGEDSRANTEKQEAQSMKGGQPSGVEGFRAGGLKEQGLRGLRNLQIADIPSCQRGPFLPPPGGGLASSLSVTSESAQGNLDTCIFCEIVRGKAPAFKLYEDEFCICILDINPLAHGHSLVIPKLHYKSLQTTPPRIAAAMCASVPIISTALMEATNCDSFNLVVNSGTAAGQVVYHTHFHIIPRCDGDGLWHSETAPRRAFMGANEAAGFVRLVRTRLAYV